MFVSRIKVVAEQDKVCNKDRRQRIEQKNSIRREKLMAVDWTHIEKNVEKH
jgi:hypothetical protein